MPHCNLCVAACPVGAIAPNGNFRFSACYDHNYREFMTGFGDYMAEVADSKDRDDLAARVSTSETASMWQSLAYKPNYKAAYCLAVCPAGEEHLAPFKAARADYVAQVLKPLTERTEQVFVVRGSDAEAHVAKQFPHKRIRYVRSSLSATSAKGFFFALPLVFQRRPTRGWSGTFHFALSGVEATVRIDDGTLEVRDGLSGAADVVITGDEAVWLAVVRKQKNPVWAVLTRQLRVSGKGKLLAKFAACFPR